MKYSGDKGVSIIILAGGFGTRMKSKTPKVMHKICGREMLFCILDEVLKISDDIHIVLFNQAESIAESLRKNYVDSTLHTHLQDYENFPGTAGAIMRGGAFRGDLNPCDSTHCDSAKSMRGDSSDSNDFTSLDSAKLPIPTKHEKILILSGDMPLIRAEKLREFIERENDIVMGILELQDATNYGRIVIKGDKVIKIIEEKDANKQEKQITLANAGIYCVKRKLLESALPQIDSNNKQGEFYLTDIIKFSDDISGVKANECDFMGVNSKLDLAKAEEFMLERLRNNAMQNGVIMHNPRSIYVECGVEFEGECEIESNVVLKGKSAIKNSKILSHTVVESSVIKDSTIGPFARIRPNSIVESSHIGDFVEIKNSTLYEVKAGHLSYLGDSEIQSGTNIGAGTITCNFDGVKKHKTFIGKNVFVGSGVQLVAPIVIENDVLIAAGSTVTKNAKSGDLVISRTKQENKSGFFYRFFGGKE